MKTKLTLFVAVIAVALFGAGCASTTEYPSDSILNSKKLRNLEIHSLNPNPSFEQGTVGWVTSGSGSGGKIEVVLNQDDLINGKQAMRLKPSSGYTRLTVKDPIKLSVGKNYQMILVIHGKVTIPFIGTTGWGDIDANTKAEGIIHQYEHGKTIVTRKIASKNGHAVTPTLSYHQRELIVEHFFLIEEKPKTK